MVTMTGDVIQDNSAGAYQHFTELFRTLQLPVYCVPGNHDVRTLMRESLSAEADFHYCATAEWGNWLLVGIDSCLDGDSGGEISAAEIQRLADILATTSAEHIIVCLHHPPLAMSSKWLNEVGLGNSEEFLRLIVQSGKVRAVLFGHVHQEFFADYDGIQIIGTPSTCRQFKPACDKFALDDKPPAYRRVELSADGSVSTELIWTTGNTCSDNY